MSTWQEVNVTIEVNTPDDAPCELAEQLVKAALEAEPAVQYVEVTRKSVLLER